MKLHVNIMTTVINQIHVGSENKKGGEGSLLDVHRDIKTYIDQLFGDRQREKMACALLFRLSLTTVIGDEVFRCALDL
jgi:hypothetical protein